MGTHPVTLASFSFGRNGLRKLKTDSQKEPSLDWTYLCRFPQRCLQQKRRGKDHDRGCISADHRPCKGNNSDNRLAPLPQ
jgi:hypothetical protein